MNAQDSSFTVGPVIGVDQFLSADSPLNDPASITPTYIRYKAGFMYGVEGSYRINRLLIDARLLSTKRVYQVISQYQFGSGPNSTTSTGAVEVAAQYISLPLTISYRLKTIKHIQLFAGGGIVPEWINGSFARKSFDIYGSGHFVRLEPEKPAKPFSVGGCLQLTGRYDLDARFILQVQPAFYYFSKVGTPFATTDNSSFRVSASVCYRLSND
ncbi:hypothetical protein [Spirosoma flavum]|uniref:Outer membrane protein beta-barrel domain-containing protein n=1 Tax=Spirosoma flavum TaxID=2048557 RepID=A0ABW6AQH2_9BACT